MAIEANVRDRIWSLYQESHFLASSREQENPSGDARRAQSVGWLTSAQNIVHVVCPNNESAYHKRANIIASTNWVYIINEGVAAMASALLNLLRDADSGALASIADQARSEVFDDFLDHASAYLGQSRKNEAGAISGIVFEDAIRRICHRRSIVEKGVKIDQLISELTLIAVLTQTKAKRARAAAHVRTKASHAQWDEFDDSNVESTIDFTKGLIAANLDA